MLWKESFYSAVPYGGETWENILFLNNSTGCADLAMDPSNPKILYASMWEFRRTAWSFESGGENSALYKSNDGGESWKKIHNGFPEGSLGRLAISVAPSKTNILYTVIEAENVPKSDKLLKLKVDTGLDKRTILSGISKYYTPEKIINKKVMVLINLKPRKMMGFESQGMLLLADDGDGNLSLMQPDSDVSDGSVVA